MTAIFILYWRHFLQSFTQPRLFAAEVLLHHLSFLNQSQHPLTPTPFTERRRRHSRREKRITIPDDALCQDHQTHPGPPSISRRRPADRRGGHCARRGHELER